MVINVEVNIPIICSEKCEKCRKLYNMPSKNCCLDNCQNCIAFIKFARGCKSGGVFSQAFSESIDVLDYKRLKAKYENSDTME